MLEDLEAELKAIDDEPSFGRIYETAKSYRKRVLAKQKDALKRMRGAYKRALNASLVELARLEDRIEELIDNGVDNLNLMIGMRERMINIVEQAREGIEKYTEEAFLVTRTGQLAMATLANEATEQITKRVLGKPKRTAPVSIAWQKMNEDVLESFVGFTADGSPLLDVFRRIAPEAETVMINAIEEGLVIGKGPRAVSADIRKQIKLSSYKAERITRTEMIRANREATRRSYNDNLSIVKGYKRMATADGRVCPACLALSGKLYTTNEVMPSHPQCRCIMVPVTKTWFEITGVEGLDDEEGTIPNGDEILQSLGEEKAKSILGPSRFQLWKDGTSVDKMGVVVNNPDYGPQTRIVPLGDLK